MENQEAKITWSDGGQPVSVRFDDPYFSLQDGLAETRYVFLEGNDLGARLVSGFHVAELGFGTGLHLLATGDLANRMNAPIRFTSFEAFPMRPDDIRVALEAFPGVSTLADDLLASLGVGATRFTIGRCEVDLILGDARQTLPVWAGMADAWFLDGFAPAKNPELWGADLMQAVANHTKPGGTFATYTASGAVRRSLGDAGFDVVRVPGFGRKRHMSRGIKAG